METIRKITVKKGRVYTGGLALLVLGIVLLLSVAMVSGLGWSGNFWEPRWDWVGLWFGFSLAHETLTGVILAVIGSAALVSERTKEKVPTATVLLECPLCETQWKEPVTKAHLLGMGYPRVKTLSRRRCSECGKFIRPKISRLVGAKVVRTMEIVETEEEE